METERDQDGSLPPLLWLSLAFVLGVALGAWVGAPAGFWLVVAALAAAASVWQAGRGTLSSAERALLLAVCALALGGLRYQLAHPRFDAQSLASYNDSPQQAVIEGVLAEVPVYRDSYVELLVQARSLNVAGQLQAVDGLLLARADLGTDWRYGDVLQLSGWLRTPADFSDFSYRDYLARKGVYSEMSFASAVRTGQGQGSPLRAGLYAIRSGGVQRLHQLYEDPAAGLLAGILLGDEGGISPRLKEAFNDTGTRHVVAISGFNISIIAGLFLAVFSRGLGARRGLWLAAGAVAVYTLLVGAQASVVRAAIMGLVALAARGLGREQFGPNTLAFTAAAMAAVNPYVLWDAGFQLSFMATLGLMTLGDRLRLWADEQLVARLSKAWVERLRGPLYDYVLLTLSAQIFTLPLLLHYFGRLSLISLPANLLILPLQPAVMVLGGLSLLAAAVLWPLGQLLALAAWPLVALTIRLVEVFAGPSWAVQDVGGLPLLWELAYYAALAVALRPGMLAPLRRMRLQPAALAAGLAVFSLWSWSLVQSQPDGLLHITLLDVPGEAMLVQTPGGGNLLINGGGSAVELTSELGRQLPLFRRELDWLLLAGERPEQINGLLAGQSNLPVAQVAWASLWPSAEFQIALDNFAAAGVPLSELQAGQQMDLGEGVTLQVWALGTRGATLLLTWGDFAALLPLGLDPEQMDDLSADPLPGVDLLLLAEEGHAAVNTQEWLAAADAQVHWLAAGGKPGESLLAALAGRNLMRVDQLGWLQATTDGHSLWLSAERDLPALIQP